jgi:hypothetical protein
MQCIFELHHAAPAPPLRRTIMEHSMKMRLATVALGAVFAAPAFAQAPDTRQNVQTSRQDGSARVHVYAPDHYTVWHGNQNANPDFQLGYSR